MLIAAFIVGVLTGGMLFAAVQADAWRAERIYRARHRDHSKVPAIHAGRSAALWAEAAAVDQLDERSTEEFRNVLVRNSGGELALVSPGGSGVAHA